jgi:uncharacterized protein (TIGR02996 family)
MIPTPARAALEHPTAEDVAALAKVWRATRSAEVAAVLEQVGSAWAAAHPPVVPRRSGAFHDAWLELAQDPSPADLSWLADSLTRQLPKPPKHLAANLLLAQRGLARRLTTLAALEPDPRLSAAVARALVSCPFAFERAGELHQLYGSAFDLLCCDVRQAEVLAAALADPQARAGITRAGLREVLPPLIARCLQVVPRLSASDAAAWRALVRAPAPARPRADEAALLREVLEHEEDDAPRLVYADALSERGDARGEFIALQLSAAPRAPPAAKRQRLLLKAYQSDWLGPLHRVFTHQLFHRGFLFEAALAHNAKAEPAVWRQALTHPELRFLHRLGQGRGSVSAYLDFLDAEGCQQVTDVDVGNDAVLAQVLRRPGRPWRSFSFKRAPGLEGLVALRAFRGLRGLVIDHLDDPQLPANLQKSGLLEQLRTLEFGWSHFAGELVALIGTGALGRITFTAMHSCVTVTHSPTGRFVVEGETEYEQLARDVLEAVRDAEQVRLCVRQPAHQELAWFDGWLAQHARAHTLQKLAKVDGAGFHERLRLALATGR